METNMVSPDITKLDGLIDKKAGSRKRPLYDIEVHQYLLKYNLVLLSIL